MHQWGADWWGAGGGWPWLGLVWLIVFLLFWGGLLALLVWAVRSSAGSRHNTHERRESSDEILRRRLANGEITPEEYDHIRRILQE